MAPQTKEWQTRIDSLEKQGKLRAIEASGLRDMVAAGREEVGRVLGFVEKYLPRQPRLTGDIPSGSMFIDAGTLSRARKRIKHEPLFATLWSELCKDCEQAVTPGGERYIDWSELRNDRLWRRRMGHWALTRAMQNLSWGWALGGERGWGRFAADILVTIARHRVGWGPTHCNYGRPYNGWLNDNLLDIGHITTGSAIAYDLVRPLMTTAERAEVASYFEPYFYNALTDRFMSLNYPGHNFSPIGFGGVGLMAMALRHDIPKERRGTLEDCLAWSEAYARFALDHIAGDDGGPIEGSGYGSASLYYTTLFAQAYGRVIGTRLLDHPTCTKLAAYLALESLPGGGAFNNFNDNHYETNVAHWPIIAAGNGQALGNWVWRFHAGPEHSARGDARERATYATSPYVLLFHDPVTSAEPPLPEGFDKVHHFPSLNHLVMRTGWEKDALHVTFQCSRPPGHAHTQADRLNYTMYAMGERLVVDSGYAMVPIPGSSEVKRMGGHAESHNQVLIDGKGQVASKGKPTDGILRWGREGDWVWVLGDATGSYENAALARRLLAVRLTKDAPLVVQADWLVPSAKGRRRYDCLLHTGAGNRITSGKNGAAAIIGGRTGARLNLLHVSAGGVSFKQDEWVDHPRARWVTQGSDHLAMLILAAGEIKRGAKNKLTATVTDANAVTGVEVSRVNRGRGVELAIESAGLRVRMDG